jgi:glycosyltransferase involved in cell wall biosynthesis
MLSILLPLNAYNGYLPIALDSIKTAVEIFNAPTELVVVVNGASAEDLSSIKNALLRYEFPTKVLISEFSNLSISLNLGLEHSTYEFVARMDGDDLCAPSRFVEQVNRLKLNDTLALVGGQVVLIDETGTAVGRARYPKKISSHLKFSNCFAHPAVMYRKSAVLRSGGYTNQFPFAEDFDLWSRISEKFKMENLDSIVLFYRMHSKQISSSNFTSQVCSTIEILGKSYAVEQDKLKSDLLNFVNKNAQQDIKLIVRLSAVKQDRLFRAVVCLMFLRRRGKHGKNGIKKDIDLIFLAFVSAPLLSIKIFTNFFLRNFNNILS